MKFQSLFYILLIAACILITGCDTDLAKTTVETDVKVYEVIDEAWKDGLGEKTNYKIDTEIKEADLSNLFGNFSDIGKLKLPQAIAVAASHNRSYSTEKEMLYLTALNQIDIEHLYEPIPFVNAGGGLQKDEMGRRNGLFANSGVQQLLATGAEIGTNIGMGWLDIISGDMRSGFSTVASAVITQPLLRGAGRKVALENLTQAQQNTLYQVRSFNRYRKSFITSIISNYYRVIQQKRKQINVFENYEYLVKTYVNLQKRAKADRVTSYEYEQAYQDMLEARSQHMQARKEYNDMLDEFKMLLAIAPNSEFELDMNELDALKEAISEEIKISESQAIEIALNQRLDLANAADKVIDAQRKVDVAADAIRAELNLVGYAGNQTTHHTMFGAISGDIERTQNNYNLSLALDLPIDRLAEKNAYRRALIALAQQQRSHQEINDKVILEVRGDYRKMQEMQMRYETEIQGMAVAEKRAKNAELLLKYGRANTRDVLDAYEDLLDAKNEATDTLVDYTIASLEFYRDTGMMKIQPDGIWEKQLPTDIYASK
jgi:outer membrane protein TolC